MTIIQCLHTAILVSDLEKAEHFYGDILGLEKVDRPLKYPGVWYQIGNYQIHLMVHSGFNFSLSNQEKWGRNHHFALGTDNLNDIINPDSALQKVALNTTSLGLIIKYNGLSS